MLPLNLLVVVLSFPEMHAELCLYAGVLWLVWSVSEQCWVYTGVFLMDSAGQLKGADCVPAHRKAARWCVGRWLGAL